MTANTEAMDELEDTLEHEALRSRLAAGCNRSLALAIRRVEEIHEASYDKAKSYVTRDGTEIPKGYTKTYSVCVREVVGTDPIATILDCLFTAGYCDMFEFADTVLGPAAPTQEGEA